MREIGRVKFAQIQQSSLKQHLDDGTRCYNPKSLLRLPLIRLTQEGVVGITSDGTEIIDVHNTRHPDSRHRGDNPISIGFTGHYEKMRGELGNHIVDGLAGENILIEYPSILTPEAIGAHLAIESSNTLEVVRFHEVIPIPPCEPFSRFAKNKTQTPKEIKASLQFLSHGTRGFYMKLTEDVENVIIQAGDIVYHVEG